MDESSRRMMDMEELKIYGNNMIEIFKDDKDEVLLENYLRQSKAIQTQCDKDFNEAQKLIKDYKAKIDACRQKTAAAESETADDAELDSLQKEWKELQQRERMLKQELRVTVNEIGDLENQRVSIDEQMQGIKKLDKEERRAVEKLSMYAYITNTIPNLDDPSKISGQIVDEDKNLVESFDFDTADSDTCKAIWKMISS